jgi:hypothetical protein
MSLLVKQSAFDRYYQSCAWATVLKSKTVEKSLSPAPSSLFPILCSDTVEN